MTKDDRAKVINLSFDGMLTAQAIKEAATNAHDRNIAEALYQSFWALWQLLCEDRRKDRPL